MQDIIQELERIQAEFSSGLSALNVVQNVLDENPGPDAAEALHVAHIFLQGVCGRLALLTAASAYPPGGAAQIPAVRQS